MRTQATRPPQIVGMNSEALSLSALVIFDSTLRVIEQRLGASGADAPVVVSPG